MNEQQPGIGEAFVRACVQFPAYALTYTVGLVVAILTDLHITTLAIAGALLGVYQGSILFGLVAFFILYSISRVVGNVAESIGYGLRYHANAVQQMRIPMDGSMLSPGQVSDLLGDQLSDR
jgi:hypothetical protein